MSDPRVLLVHRKKSLNFQGSFLWSPFRTRWFYCSSLTHIFYSKLDLREYFVLISIVHLTPPFTPTKHRPLDIDNEIHLAAEIDTRSNQISIYYSHRAECNACNCVCYFVECSYNHFLIRMADQVQLPRHVPLYVHFITGGT